MIMTGKLILFYKYIEIQYPKQVQKWQEKLCKELNLKGRIILAHEGINGTIGGSEENIQKYISNIRENELFNDIDFKESVGSADCFPKLKILIKEEIVKLGISPKLVDAQNAGKHLTPKETHNLINSKPKDLIILDARNNYESIVGAFKDAIKPNIKNFRDLPKFIDENADLFKDKEVLMYCTGGIRCERASAYLKTKGISKEVYQIQGGIHRYIEEFPNGFFRGKNYVFDARLTLKANDDTLGKCVLCNCANDDYNNCLNVLCNKHFIACADCQKKFKNTCSEKCYNLVEQNKVKLRTEFKKLNFENLETQ